MENMNQAEMNMTEQKVSQAPVAQLRTNRGLLKLILLSLVTLGIYGLIVTAHISEDVNVVCSRYDGKKTMNYWLLIFLVGPLTLGIGYIVWMHKLCERLGKEADSRGLDCKFGGNDRKVNIVFLLNFIDGVLKQSHVFFTREHLVYTTEVRSYAVKLKVRHFEDLARKRL